MLYLINKSAILCGQEFSQISLLLLISLSALANQAWLMTQKFS